MYNIFKHDKQNSFSKNLSYDFSHYIRKSILYTADNIKPKVFPIS